MCNIPADTFWSLAPRFRPTSSAARPPIRPRGPDYPKVNIDGWQKELQRYLGKYIHVRHCGITCSAHSIPPNGYTCQNDPMAAARFILRKHASCPRARALHFRGPPPGSLDRGERGSAAHSGTTALGNREDRKGENGSHCVIARSWSGDVSTDMLYAISAGRTGEMAKV